jgi:Ca2+-binding EF-hand superfamily protein
VLSGAGLTAVTFSLFATLTGYGVHEQRFLIGARNPSQRPLPVAQSSFEAADLNTVVKVPPPLEDPLKAIGIVYFKIIRALDVLDADKDLAISPWETFTAPAALRRLDMDNDGKLSAEELGYSLGSNSTPGDVVERTRAAFMRENPVLAALDANQDREVSAFEIANSFRSLRTLDRNGDGGLTLAELLPDQQNIRAAMLFMKLDANGDERISREEREGPDESSVRGLLHGADRNNDGFVTRNELQVELRLRAEQKRQLEAARLAGGVRSVP